MPTLNSTIEFALTRSHFLYDQFIADLTEAEYLRRPVPGANCVAWLTGHLILTERRALAAAEVADLPPLPEGFEARFGRDEVAAGAQAFGDTTILRPLLAQHRRLLISALRELTPDQLDKPLPNPTTRAGTVGEVIHFMALHMTLHTGQISTIRRSLGKPPVM